MTLGEAIYIGDNIEIDTGTNSVIFKDSEITQIRVFEAISILSKQVQFIQNKCTKTRDNCGKDLVVIH